MSVVSVVCPRSLLGCAFPWLAALHGGRYARAMRSHRMHHRQPSSPQDRTFSGRNSSLCRALPARFVSSLAFRWPGLACLAARERERELLAASPAARETFPRPPDYCAHASQGSTERRPSNTCAAHQRPPLEHPSEPSRALPCVACMGSIISTCLTVPILED